MPSLRPWTIRGIYSSFDISNSDVGDNGSSTGSDISFSSSPGSDVIDGGSGETVTSAMMTVAQQ